MEFAIGILAIIATLEFLTLIRVTRDYEESQGTVRTRTRALKRAEKLIEGIVKILKSDLIKCDKADKIKELVDNFDLDN